MAKVSGGIPMCVCPTKAEAVIMEWGFSLPRVAHFPLPDFWADNFAVAFFSAASFSEGAFTSFFLAPPDLVEGIGKENQRSEVMGEMTTHRHPTLYYCIHLTIAIYLMENQLGF
jgi:hypothetical protein